MKIITVIGTRPEIIRLSRVMAALDEFVDHVIVHTGQNYDYELNQVFFDDLELRRPDHFLDVETSSVGRVYGEILIKIEKVFADEKPDGVVILGDTNSSIAAVIARRMKIPIFHMEAGNRCFDWEVPEETNRRLVDHISNINLVYTEHARRNLLAEGIHPQRIVLTGSPMKEVLDHYRPGIDASEVLATEGLDPQGYLLASLHREENVDTPERLAGLMEGLHLVGDTLDVPVLLSTHPRTLKRLEEQGVDSLGDRIRLHKPFGFFDYNHLQMHARCVISDSGTISEEAGILGFPAVTPRVAIERPESIDSGGIVVAGRDPAAMLQAVQTVLGGGAPAVLPFEYLIDDTSQRVIRLIAGRSYLRA